MRQRLQLEFEIRPGERGFQEGARRTPSPSVPLRHLKIGTAFIVPRIEVWCSRNAGFRRRFHEGIENAPARPGLGDMQFAARAVMRRSAEKVILM